jgi:hypothetical protein
MPPSTPLDTPLGLKEVTDLAIQTVSEEWAAMGFLRILKTRPLRPAAVRGIGGADMLPALLTRTSITPV